MNADGANQRPLTRGHDSSPAWSADGRRVVFCRHGKGRGAFSIYVVNADGTNPVALTRVRLSTGTPRSSDLLAAPAWSPDGRRIAYLVTAWPVRSEIWIMNANGSGKRRLVANAIFLTGRPAWSPDGHSIAFASNRTGHSDIYAMNLTTGRTQNLTKDKAANGMPTWSPDGHSLAFTSSRDQGNMDIYVLDLDTRRVTRLTSYHGDDTEPAWAPSSNP